MFVFQYGFLNTLLFRIFHPIFARDFQWTHFMRCDSWIFLSLSLGLESTYEWGQFNLHSMVGRKKNKSNEFRLWGKNLLWVCLSWGRKKKGGSQAVTWQCLEAGCRLDVGFPAGIKKALCYISPGWPCSVGKDTVWRPHRSPALRSLCPGTSRLCSSQQNTPIYKALFYLNLCTAVSKFLQELMRHSYYKNIVFT